MNNGTIDLQRNGFIATLVINRPAKLNALTPEMLEQLLTHCHTLETDSEIRVVLLTSASEKRFVSVRIFIAGPLFLHLICGATGSAAVIRHLTLWHNCHNP